MMRYRKSLALFIAFVVLFELLVIVTGTLVRPGWEHWSDETRLHATIVEFGKGIDLDLLKYYDQMSPPAPFIVYALWGWVFGFELFTLRVLSVLIAVATYLIFHRLLFNTARNGKIAFWCGALLVAQPYMIGLSIFIYTDMLTIFFLLVCLWAFMQRRAFWMGLGLAMAVLSRQYAAFLTVALVGFFAVEYIRARRSDTVRMLLSSIIAMLPYAALVVLWGGLSPEFEARSRLLDDQLYYHPPILSLYVSLICIYLFPMLVWRWRELYRRPLVWMPALLSSVYFVIFPIEPSQSSVKTWVFTVGLFHRALLFLWDNYWFVQTIFCIAFVLAMPVMMSLVVDAYRRAKARAVDNFFLLNLAVISFMVVMPFSYLGWEKYFMPIVPVLIIRLAAGSDDSLGLKQREA